MEWSIWGWQIWIPTAVFAAVLFAARNWLKAIIERGVQYTFDEKLEKLRTEFRESEERLKSELRSKEAEISALREGVLSGRLNRQSLLDKRRIEAVEQLWKAVIELAPYKFARI